MNKRNRVIISLLALLVASGVSAADRKTSIRDTKHNLSTSGKGEIKSLTESRVCIFCHSSHNSSKDGPLWNHQTTVPGIFKTYSRSTMIGKPEQPNGATKLCLSCHDGTIAVGAIRGLVNPVPMTGVNGTGEIPDGKKSNLGIDLTGTHPVSIRFEQNTAMANSHLKWPPLDPEKSVGTDADGYVQCTACHDPHGSKSDRYPLWKKATFSEVCVVCHEY